mmetsp:Transcript_6541/g.15825  ORF Transcript_6541/g.15825 Transcript_6541/m.15825 type:complete len:253 (+) Transcript_6541:358-1116(+)
MRDVCALANNCCGSLLCDRRHVLNMPMRNVHLSRYVLAAPRKVVSPYMMLLVAIRRGYRLHSYFHPTRHQKNLASATRSYQDYRTLTSQWALPSSHGAPCLSPSCFWRSGEPWLSRRLSAPCLHFLRPFPSFGTPRRERKRRRASPCKSLVQRSPRGADCTDSSSPGPPGSHPAPTLVLPVSPRRATRGRSPQRRAPPPYRAVCTASTARSSSRAAGRACAVSLAMPVRHRSARGYSRLPRLPPAFGAPWRL